MGERLLIRGGRVLTLDPGRGELPRGDVLVVDGRIAEVAREIEVADTRSLGNLGRPAS